MIEAKPEERKTFFGEGYEKESLEPAAPAIIAGVRWLFLVIFFFVSSTIERESQQFVKMKFIRAFSIEEMRKIAISWLFNLFPCSQTTVLPRR